MDPGFRVLEGRFKFQCGDRKFIAGGFENFFEEISQFTRQDPPDLEQIITVASKYDLELIP